MKKYLVSSLILVFALSSVSLALSVGPKVTMATGDYNGLAVGVESYFYNVTPAFQLGAEGSYKLATNNIGWIQVGGIGRYMIPMENPMFMPYVGGGLNYNMYNINISGAGSASGIGFKLFGGADFPVAGMGTFFGNVGFASQTFNYTIPIFGTISASGSGLYLDGGYRFSF